MARKTKGLCLVVRMHAFGVTTPAKGVPLEP